MAVVASGKFKGTGRHWGRGRTLTAAGLPHSHSRMSEPTPTERPADLIAVFAAVERAMGGGRLNPETLRRVPSDRDAVIPGHSVHFRHRPKNVAERYVIELSGDRWTCARWSFRSGQLAALARENWRKEGLVSKDRKGGRLARQAAFFSI